MIRADNLNYVTVTVQDAVLCLTTDNADDFVRDLLVDHSDKPLAVAHVVNPHDKDHPLDPVVPLVQLCQICDVTVKGLQRAGKTSDEQVANCDLVDVLNMYFNADSSVQDVMALIVEAAREPRWIVYGRAAHVRDDHTVRVYDPYCVRAVDSQEAEAQARQELWGKHQVAFCRWRSRVVSNPDNHYDVAGGGYVRIDR